MLIMNYPIIKLNLFISQIFQYSGPDTICLSSNQPVPEVQASRVTLKGATATRSNKKCVSLAVAL